MDPDFRQGPHRVPPEAASRQEARAEPDARRRRVRLRRYSRWQDGSQREDTQAWTVARARRRRRGENGNPAAAQAIIARQPEGTPEDLVFAPASGEGVISLSKPWAEVRAEAKLPEGIGLHGLRHSLASHMAMGGAAAAEIMTALGHTQL